MDLVATLEAVQRQQEKYKGPVRVGQIQHALKTPERQAVYAAIQILATQGMLDMQSGPRGNGYSVSSKGKAFLES